MSFLLPDETAIPSPTRVILIDDDPLVRVGIRRLLETRSSLEIVGEASDGRSALWLISELRPDVVLLDVRMPGINGLFTVRAIRRQFHNSIRIVLMSALDSEHLAAEARSAGADVFIRKTASVDHFVYAITGVRDRSVPPPRMSGRELEVAARLAKGYSNERIADELGVTVNTVKTYVSRLFNKFQVANRTQLANRLNGVRM